MNKEFIETEKLKYELMKTKYQALENRDGYYFNLFKKIAIIVSWLSLISC